MVTFCGEEEGAYHGNPAHAHPKADMCAGPAVSPHQEYICEGRKRRCFRISRFQFAPFGQLNLANLSAPPSTSTNYCCCGGDSPQIAEARREVNSRTANEGRCGVRTGMGSNGVTVTKFLQFLITLELYLELSYIWS